MENLIATIVAGIVVVGFVVFALVGLFNIVIGRSRLLKKEKENAEANKRFYAELLRLLLLLVESNKVSKKTHKEISKLVHLIEKEIIKN